MSKLPLVDAKTLEKILLELGFKIKRQKGSHVFIVTQMVDIQPYHITRAEILDDHYSAIYLGKSG